MIQGECFLTPFPPEGYPMLYPAIGKSQVRHSEGAIQM